MSFRRGFGGRGGGRFGGGGGRFSRGGGGGGFRNDQNYEVSNVVPLGYYAYECQGDLICKVEIEDVPFFSANIYLENKKPIGKVDEIFGNIRDYYISIRLLEDVKAKSFPPNQKLYIDPAKLLPLKRFLPQPPGQKRGGGGGGRGRGGGGFRGRGGGRPSFGRGGGGRPSFGGSGGRPSFRGGGGRPSSRGGGFRGGWKK